VNKNEYLTHPVVKGFCAYLGELVDGRTFNYAYKVTWKPWIAAKGLLANQSTIQGSCLEDAFKSYFWPVAPSDDDEEEGSGNVAPEQASFLANAGQLTRLRDSIRTALSQADEQRLFVACMKILDWGRVYRGAVGWLIAQVESRSLAGKLTRAIEILDGDGSSSISEFAGNRSLRMDSGLTKIYSLAAESTIIYDDRVGAAIGLLAREFLRSRHISENEKARRVPHELAFMRSHARSRNPSEGSYAFPGKPTGDRAGELHARSNLWANWILGSIAGSRETIWGFSDFLSKLRALEAALFMLGYRVDGRSGDAAAFA
jgi:hypothetical protein